MPQVNIIIAKEVDDITKKELQLEIGGAMSLLPGKNIDNTIMSICDGCSMFKSGQPLDGAFVDVRLFKSSPEESKKEFSAKVFSIFKEIVDIEPNCIYMNFIEMEHWASGGKYN